MNCRTESKRFFVWQGRRRRQPIGLSMQPDADQTENKLLVCKVILLDALSNVTVEVFYLLQGRGCEDQRVQFFVVPKPCEIQSYGWWIQRRSSLGVFNEPGSSSNQCQPWSLSRWCVGCEGIDSKGGLFDSWTNGFCAAPSAIGILVWQYPCNGPFHHQ